MLKTNTKKAIKNIRNYIWVHTEGSFKDFKDVANHIRTRYEKEKPYSQKNINILGLTNYEVFREWAQGLPMDTLFLYYYNVSAVDLLGDILEETKEERNMFSEEQAEERLTQLIFREISKF